MATNALKKITTRAKAIRKSHPGVSWKSAVKKAGAEYRTGKISGVKKKKKPARKKASRKVAGRSSRKAVGKVGYRRTDGAVIGSIAGHKKALRHAIEEKLAWKLLAISSAKKVRTKKKLQKTAAQYKKDLRALA